MTKLLRRAAQCALGLLLLTAIGLQGAAAQQNFSALYVFGDSLADNGNRAASGEGIGPVLLIPPYDRGRASNGPVAPEVLAGLLGLDALAPVAAGGTNYAVAQARARGNGGIDYGGQVADFLTAKSNSAPGDALYLIIIGSNDVRDARDRGNRVGRVLVNRAVTKLYRHTKSLIERGARKIIVATSPDMGSIPETVALQTAGEAGLTNKARGLSRRFNSGVRRIVRRLESEFDVDIVIFDIFAFLQTIQRNADALGLTSAHLPCFVFTAAGPVFTPGCESPENYDRFAFADAIHPSVFSNERAARSMYAIVPRLEPVAEVQR